MIAVTREGYQIPFVKNPPKSNFPIPATSYHPTSEKFRVLDGLISDMLQKSATDIIMDNSEGFYSRIFVVPMHGGKWRLIIDLSPLNVYIPK